MMVNMNTQAEKERPSLESYFLENADIYLGVTLGTIPIMEWCEKLIITRYRDNTAYDIS